MPTARELTILIEDRPGALAKLCHALANRGVNIIAVRASSDENRSQVHFIVDNPAAAKIIFSTERLAYTDTEVAQATLPNRPGELARAAGHLGEAHINIHVVYGGVDPRTNTPLIFFGVPEGEVAQAAQILDQVARGT